GLADVEAVVDDAVAVVVEAVAGLRLLAGRVVDVGEPVAVVVLAVVARVPAAEALDRVMDDLRSRPEDARHEPEPVLVHRGHRAGRRLADLEAGRLALV